MKASDPKEDAGMKASDPDVYISNYYLNLPQARIASPASTSAGESPFLKSQTRETGNKGPGRGA